jgi:hypothetical protein
MDIEQYSIPEYKPDIVSWDKYPQWDERTISLTAPFHCAFVINKVRYDIRLDVGYKSDGGTIPRIFWYFISPHGKGLPAFLVHDALYAMRLFNRKQADDIMKAILLKNGIIPWIATGVHRVVRCCGWWAWDRNASPAKMKLTSTVIS